ncbi:MAG: hypothetical protein M3167_17920 [Acidobacteriota bacterium]|nr:hypothetical protein [Acidobacteriota bacterium]
MIAGGFVWLAALVFLPLAGAIPISHPAFGRFTAIGRVTIAGGVGGVLIATAMTLCALLGWRWTFSSVGATAAALGILARLSVPRRDRSPLTPALSRGEREQTPLTATFSRRERGIAVASRVVIGCAIAAAFVSAASSAATSADLVLLWGPKAQQFAAARTIDAGYLGKPALEYMNTAYPPLVTNLYALGSMLAGRFSWGGAMLTFPILLLAIAAALPSALELRRLPRVSLPWCALVVAVVASAGAKLLVAGNADVALLFFEVTSLALLLGPARRDPALQFLAGLLFAGAATSKVEGLPFTLAAGALFVAANRRDTRMLPAAIRLWTPPAFSLGLWFFYGAERRVFTGYRGFGPVFQIFWDRLGSVLVAIGNALAEVHHALPFVLPVVVFLLLAPKTPPGWVPAAVGTVLALFLLFNYLHGPDPTEWIGWSAGRVLLPLPLFLTLSSASRILAEEGEIP